MGRDTAEQATPDLFSTDAVRDASPSPTKPTLTTKAAADASAQRYILPKNLRHAISQLSDGELDDLCEAAFDEAKQRRRLRWSVGYAMVTKRSPVTKKLERTRTDNAELLLTRGQLNAVRAAFKAGITSSRIARQFGISQSDVRKALASAEPRR